MKKIKIFLAGYVNYTNAQNLNCLAVGNYLDKEKFEPLALTAYFGKKQQFEIKTFHCFRPFTISKNIRGQYDDNLLYVF